MEALCVRSREEEKVMTEEEGNRTNGEQDEGETETSSAVVSSTDEETGEDSEPEPPPGIRRKVSFADAFGLDLVSVKEFDKVEVTESEPSWSNGRKVVKSIEEIYLSCLFTVPSSTEELDQKLCEQMVELESIGLLPGTTNLRGIIRVVNLCYNKSVYVRITLNSWKSYFDLLAEYIPGSSDRKTDRFTFRYTMVPPFEKEGSRVEFCLRYETPMGTFWANNKGMNYVMFCHQKALVRGHVTQTQEETSSYRSKRSCLKANRNGDTEETTKESIQTNIAAADVEGAGEVTKTSLEAASLRKEDQKPWVESVKRRRRAIRLSRVQDFLCQKVQQQPKSFSHESVCSPKVYQHAPALCGDSASYLNKSQPMQSRESPQILTYHQIPLLTLDWSSPSPGEPSTGDVADILTGSAKVTLATESEENTPPVNDMWESLSKTTHDSYNKESSVRDVWQVFLNGPGCKHHPDVSESEWLQTAASMFPSKDKELQIQYSEESREFEDGTDTPTTLKNLAACQLLSDTCETLLAGVALIATDDQPAEACVTSPEDKSTAMQDPCERSQTNFVTDTPQEFNLKEAPPLPKDTVDSQTESHRHKDWEQESKGKIVAEGRGEGEPFALHTPDSVTCSGDSETTDMTIMPENLNASNVDIISPDANQDGWLSTSGEREVKGTEHNRVDVNLAFREIIWEETKDRDGYILSTSRQREEEDVINNYMEKKETTEEEFFSPQETKECTLPRMYGDKIQCDEFIQSQTWEIDENEVKTGRRQADELDSQQTYDGILNKNQHISTDENKDRPFNFHKMKIVKKEVRAVGIQSKEEEVNDNFNEIIKILDKVQLQHEDESSSVPIGKRDTGCAQLNELLHVEDKILRQVEECCDHRSETASQDLNYGSNIMKQNEVSPTAGLSPTADTLQAIAWQISHNPQISCHTGRYDRNHLEVLQPTLTDTQQESLSQNHNSSRDKRPEEVMAHESGAKRDTLAEHQPKKSRLKQNQSTEKEKDPIPSVDLRDNAERDQGENKTVWEGASKEFKTYPHLEGTKDPITVENRAALVTQSGIEKMVIEKFGDKLVRSIWEEVFAQEVQPSTCYKTPVDGTRSWLTGKNGDFPLVCEKNLSDTYDSDMFLSNQFPADSFVNLSRGLEPTFLTEGNEYSPKNRFHPPDVTAHTNSSSELHSDLDSISHLSTFVHCGQRICKTTQSLSLPQNQENSLHIKARLVSHKENDFGIEGCMFADTETSDRSPHLSNKARSSSEKLKESDALLWWTILYTISHITRLLICTLLVGGFFVVVFLYDFPAFFALYVFSMSWWIFKWKRHRVATGKTITE